MYSVIIIICGAGAIMYNDTVKKIYTERVRTIVGRRREWLSRRQSAAGGKDRVCSHERTQSETRIKEESRRESRTIFSTRSNIVLHGGKYI